MAKNSSWIASALGEMLTFQRGFDITKAEQSPGPYPVISSSGTSSFHSEFKIQGPGVVIGRKGTLGTVFFAENDYWPHDTTLWVRDFHNNDPRFAYYFLKAFHFEKYDCGASNPTLNRNHIHVLPVQYPELLIQRKIAAILSAYDDLIENNTRRIKILEEVAQTIYREWFVEFRFPGHEKAKMVPSVPRSIPWGWEIVRVGDIVRRVPSGRKYDNKAVSPTGSVPVLDQGKSGIIGYHDDDPGVVASEEHPVVVFANHTCYQKIVQFSFSAIQNVLPFLSSIERSRDILWLHWATKDLIKFNDYKGHWPEFMAKKLVLPPADVCALFGKTVKPMVQYLYRLNRENANLRRTRDLLLPKLISGEIDVPHLDIRT